MMKAIRRFLDKLFGKNTTSAPAPPPFTPPAPMPPAPVPPAPVPAPPPVVALPTFVDGFDSGKIDPSKWIISTWSAPGSNATHKGTFLAKNATIVNGVLCLTLNQSAVSYGISSKGAEIATVQKFGYGTYEYSVRASSTAATSDVVGTPVSGSITGCFNYLTASATEIDIEVEGNERNRTTQLTSWIDETKPNEHTDVSPAGALPHEAFFDYKFVWTPGKIQFYRNNVLIGTHTKVVPTQPAPFLFNHWGTNNTNWGGIATPNITRYMWVKNFRFTPL